MTIFRPNFEYPVFERVEIEGKRFYRCPTGAAVPSVTTVLDATADKAAIDAWVARVGLEEAERVRKDAVGLGGLVHLHMEAHLLGQPRPRGNNLVRRMAERMADSLIANALPNVDEVWGMEVSLCYPTLYAGTTDLVGLYKGRPAIMDYKTTKKLKIASMIPDYFCQLAAYALAHDNAHDTNIQCGVIFMIDHNGGYRDFPIEGAAFDAWKTQFLLRLERFLEQRDVPAENVA